MATQVGSLFYDLNLDDTGFKQGLNNVDGHLKGFSSKMDAIGSKMTDVGKKATIGITLPIVGAFGFAVKSASDLNETMNKIDVAFGESGGKVKAWASTSISSMGLAKQSALDATALFGDMSTSMGINQVEASNMSMGLTQLGADLASFKNISFERAQTALAGVYTGETEALKGLGIVMTQSNLATFAQQQGITKTIDQMSQAELVQLRYNYVMDKTKNAQGDFARTADGTANRTRIMQEQFKETSATLGQNLLPVANRVMEWVTGLTEKFSKLSPEQQKMVLIIGAIVAVIPPLLVGLGMLVTAIGSLSVAFGFLSANPVVLAVIAIVLVIAGLAFLVIKNWDTLKKWFSSFVGAVSGFFKDLWGDIKGIMTTIGNFFKAVWDGIYGVVSTVFTAIAGFWNNTLKPVFDVMIAIITTIMGIYIKVWAFIALVVIGTMSMIASVIWSVMQGIWNVITTIWDAIFGVIKGVLSFIWNAITAYFNFYLMIITTVLGFIWGTITRIWGAISPFISGVLSAIWNSITGAFNAVWGFISGIWNNIYRTISNAVSNIWGGITGTFNNVVNFVSGIGGRILGSMGNFGSLLYDKGKNLVQGLIDGAGSLLSKIGQFFLDKVPSYIREPFKKALGISSPSKVFAEYGKFTMQGLQQGINKNAGLVEGALSRVGSGMDLQLSASTGINGGSGSDMAVNASGTPISITIAPQGIMARSTSELRDITKEMLATVDQELRAKGKPTLLGN